MNITSEDIRHLAKLARLGITDEQVEKYVGEIDAILTYVKQLQSVDVSGVKPTYQTTDLQNMQRDDLLEQSTEEQRKQLLGNAPHHDDELFLITRVK